MAVVPGRLRARRGHAYASLIAQSQELVEQLNVGRDGRIVLESSYLAVIARK
jgi:hypothetical protein